ncbi:hypothetical protein N781_15550 [Pontibacillus halophilus JSM 076056 = DSM 19796]|uniref:Uncharacterized protein n=1 Tax=Pontibacillus halophilus JSM 076056 = DSM 19796 TaxID=1385510 RepID=A0A0A5GLB2_9BACI|nr:hypothetical protein [Pontibacillus halophilus]KGX92799.1 hypothetical protein N781_15550 [Pontibacillus halophilus JSM 076056 = DSM 19796]
MRKSAYEAMLKKQAGTSNTSIKHVRPKGATTGAVKKKGGCGCGKKKA